MDDVHEARRRFGGAMRQSGVLAAACLYGVEHNIARLADDHATAARFAEIVRTAPGVAVTTPETNIVMVTVPATTTPLEVERRAAARGVGIALWDTTRVRAVTHLDVTIEQVEQAARSLVAVLADAA